jgi:hypothetical protein
MKKGMTVESVAPVIPTLIPGIAALILYLSVNLHKISTVGKKFHWQRPLPCPRCGGVRLWSHGYVERYFGRFAEQLWMKRWRCPDCRAVHTARPLEYWRGFQATAAAIVASLWYRGEKSTWLDSFSRQRQEYWWRGLQICRLIHGAPTDLEALLDGGKIVATHSLHYREIRYAEDPPHRIFAFTPPVRAP